MTILRKKATHRRAGLNIPVSRKAQAIKQSGYSICNAIHTSKVAHGLHENGIGHDCTSRELQRSTLLRALKSLSARGLNTFEGAAADSPQLSLPPGGM